jgi:hypothetical protein
MLKKGITGLRGVLMGGLLVSASMLTGCASFYVDTAIKDVPASEIQKAAQPKPVQLIFDFQTKGAPNSRAADFLRAQVTDQIKATQLFSSVDDKPVAGGAILSVVLNNIPLDDSPEAKGFVTGLTFGLKGNMVTDGYVCTVTYLPGGTASPIVKIGKHAIHTTIGASAAPLNAVKAENVTEAVKTMTRQIVGNTLRDLSQDPVFR